MPPSRTDEWLYKNVCSPGTFVFFDMQSGKSHGEDPPGARRQAGHFITVSLCHVSLRNVSALQWGTLQSLYRSRGPSLCSQTASVAPPTSSPPASPAAQVSGRAPQLLPLLVVIPLRLLLLPLLLRLRTKGTRVNVRPAPLPPSVRSHEAARRYNQRFNGVACKMLRGRNEHSAKYESVSGLTC